MYRWRGSTIGRNRRARRMKGMRGRIGGWTGCEGYRGRDAGARVPNGREIWLGTGTWRDRGRWSGFLPREVGPGSGRNRWFRTWRNYGTDIGAACRLTRVRRRGWILQLPVYCHAPWHVPVRRPLCVRAASSAPTPAGKYGLSSGADLVFRFPLAYYPLWKFIHVISLILDQR